MRQRMVVECTESGARTHIVSERHALSIAPPWGPAPARNTALRPLPNACPTRYYSPPATARQTLRGAIVLEKRREVGTRIARSEARMVVATMVGCSVRAAEESKQEWLERVSGHVARAFEVE